MKKFCIGLLVGLLVAAAVPFALLAAGAVNMSASEGPGPLEDFVGTVAMENSVAARAPDQQNPFAGDPEAIKAGFVHYREMCLLCHGAPGVEPVEFAKGLTPPAPALDRSVREFTPGELFWIAKHGVRMTGMPAFGGSHSDEEIWQIIAFVEQLPKLTEKQRSELQAAAAGHRHDSNRHGDGHHRHDVNHEDH
jgi:mono/diheme cytochrome c family protein